MDIVSSEDIYKVRVGSKVNLVTFLSSRERDYLVDGKGKQVKVSTLEGNYVMIYCFPIPLPLSPRKQIYCALKSAISIWQKKEIKFKLVVVAKMSPGFGSNDLNVFLSDIPSCLAIPISDSVSCDRLWSGIFEYGGLIIDSNQTVLSFGCCSFLKYFGDESYPFTRDHIRSLRVKLEESLEERPVRLESLLGLQLSDRLYNADGNVITVSQLKTKLVGLYLFVTGSNPHLRTISRVFSESHPALEIVVVHVSLGKDHQACVLRSVLAFIEMKISSWWISPYHQDTASRKLWWLCDGYETDSFIIVGPNGKYLERKGINACSALPYPYAREHLAFQETEILKKLSRDTFLAKCFPVNPDNHIQLTDLQKKNVILFIGNCDDRHFKTTLELMEIWCRGNKGCHEKSNISFVFVPLHASSKKLNFSDPKMSWILDHPMSWLTCNPDSIIQQTIYQQKILYRLALRDVLSFIAFGEEGRIVSIAHPVLSSYYEANVFNDFPLLKRGADGNLPDQLYEDVLDAFRDMVDDE
ncbi:protein-disulfide reductase [Ranunculus cassubicifolius]